MSRFDAKNPYRLVILAILFASILPAIVAGCILPDEDTYSRPSPTSGPSVTSPAFSGTPLEVHFLDVGQGDSVLLVYGDKNMLIDGGTYETGPAVVPAYLKSLGITTIDVLVATHPHSDHLGGLPAVMDQFNVIAVYDNGQTHTAPTYRDYLKAIDRNNLDVVELTSGQRIDFAPGITVEVLSPPGSLPFDDLNENSLVIKVTHGSVKFLFTGDVGTIAENHLLNAGMGLDSDVLKVAHHGSSHSTGKAFLGEVSPEVSIIEVGADNDYNYPAASTVSKLMSAGSEVYRTDLDGTVIVTSDGTDYKVTTQK